MDGVGGMDGMVGNTPLLKGRGGYLADPLAGALVAEVSHVGGLDGAALGTDQVLQLVAHVALLHNLHQRGLHLVAVEVVVARRAREGGRRWGGGAGGG